MQFLCTCTNSTGSSMVMMWPWLCSLRWPIIAASVVDLPEPVAPTIRIRPRCVIDSSLITGGRFRVARSGISLLITRSTRPVRPICVKALTRKRPMPPGLMAKFSSLLASNSAAWRSFISARASSMVCWVVSGLSETGTILPLILKAGGKSTVRNRSEPSLAIISRSRSYRKADACSRSIRAVFWGPAAGRAAAGWAAELMSMSRKRPACANGSSCRHQAYSGKFSFTAAAARASAIEMTFLRTRSVRH